MKTEVLRKLIHMATVVVIPASFFVSRELIVVIGTLFCISYITAEYFRFRNERVAFITDVIKRCARGKELEGWVLTPFFLLFSITVLIGLTPIIGMKAAYVGILAATLGDSSAALIGMRFGRHRTWILRGKSVEGSLGFFAFTFLSSLLFVEWPIALILSSITAVVEVFSAGIDNLSVPFSAALIAGILM
jgi:phytol kinase